MEEDNDAAVEKISKRSATAALVRFFSIESDKSDKVYGLEWNPPPEFRYGVFSREFLLKFLQLVSWSQIKKRKTTNFWTLKTIITVPYPNNRSKQRRVVMASRFFFHHNNNKMFHKPVYWMENLTLL